MLRRLGTQAGSEVALAENRSTKTGNRSPIRRMSRTHTGIWTIASSDLHSTGLIM
jgi:hypothetical protein